MWKPKKIYISAFSRRIRFHTVNEHSRTLDKLDKVALFIEDILVLRDRARRDDMLGIFSKRQYLGNIQSTIKEAENTLTATQYQIFTNELKARKYGYKKEKLID